MNIQDIFPPPSTSNVNQPKKQLGQEDFMKLLVAQMKNQDPSNPAENGEFLAQIAQFSMVQGIDKLGKSFDGIATNFYNNQAMQASDLVGKQVLAGTNAVVYDPEQDVQGYVEIPEFANGLNIQVRDSQGGLVKTISSAGFEPGATYAFKWDGTNEKGEEQPAGDYIITATALVEGKQEAVRMSLYNTVNSISVSADRTKVQLELANGQLVDFSQISQYR
jgi:flagellar basal-body rod modification protein FlgD